MDWYTLVDVWSEEEAIVLENKEEISGKLVCSLGVLIGFTNNPPYVVQTW